MIKRLIIWFRFKILKQTITKSYPDLANWRSDDELWIKNRYRTCAGLKYQGFDCENNIVVFSKNYGRETFPIYVNVLNLSKYIRSLPTFSESKTIPNSEILKEIQSLGIKKLDESA